MHPWLTEILPAIQDRLSQVLTEQQLPGLAVGVVCDQELAWSGGFGWADLDNRRSPDADTLSRVASITKTFTATAILQLRDAGKLQLDDPLARHLPEFAGAHARAGTVEGVTLRRMLAHHAGLTTEPPLPTWDSLTFPTRDALNAALPRIEVVIPQDTAFKYSNLAYGLLGEVIRRVSGVPYDEYIRKEILGPLGMKSSVFELSNEMRPRLAVGYSPQRFADRPARAPYISLQGMGACGQMHSSVHDLSKWISQQFRTGDRAPGANQILKGSTLEESHRPQYLEPDWSVGYCLGWRAVRVENRVYHGHGGGIHGFASQILFSKQHRLGVICLANIWPHPGILPVATELLQTLVAAQRSEAATAEPPRAAPAELAAYLGAYEATAGIPVHVVFREGALRLEKSPLTEYSLHAPAELEPTAKAGAFIVRGGRGAGERAEFELAGDGSALRFELGGFIYRKLQPAVEQMGQWP